MEDNFNQEPDDNEDNNGWLATYSDLVTLLLCFFVLLFSMSSIDNGRFKNVVASFASAFSLGVIDGGGNSIIDLDTLSNIDYSDKVPKTSQAPEDKEMSNLYTDLRKLINEKGLSSYINLESDQKGLLLVFRDDLLFDQGKANLKPSVRDLLFSIANILKDYDKKIRIEGHTDDIPIKNKHFASNWELSAARAISVVKYFTEELPPNHRMPPNRFEVAGLAEFSPVAPNDTAENKQKNRRIEIIIIE